MGLTLYKYVEEVFVRIYYVSYGVLLIFSSVFYYREEYLVVYIKPFWKVVCNGSLMFTGMGEVFQTYLALALMYGMCGLIMLLILNVYLFLLPGSFQYERYYLHRSVLSLICCFGVLVYIVHKYLVSFVCKYLLMYSEVEGVGGIALRFEPRIGELIFFIMCLDFLLCFLVCLISVCFLLNSSRQWVYMSGVVVIVVLLPADMILHLMVFSGLVIWCELVMFSMKVYKRYKFVWWNR